MKKYILDLTLTAVEHLHERYVLLKATDAMQPLPEMQPGQFAQLEIKGSKQTFLRRPISIHNVDIKNNEVWFLIQMVGDGTRQLAKMQVGDMLNVILPLGNGFSMPANHSARVLLVGGGVGVAPLLPIVQAMKAAGNKVISVLAARNKELIILEDEIRKSSDEVIIMTDDGSYGKQGVVTVGMEEAIAKEKIDFCMVIGPAIMMKFAALTTKKYEIPTYASLNTIMVDGTGMCGACRVTIDGKTKFVCVDGPEFDAHKVDFGEMMMRMGAYKAEEKEALEQYLQTTK